MRTRVFEVWEATPDAMSEPDDNVTVTLAALVQSSDHEYLWHCERRIDAFGTTRVHVIAGIAGMQAFQLGMRWAETENGFLARQRKHHDHVHERDER